MTATRELGRSGLHVAPLAFGGNVFGWSADEKASFALLDAFVDAGFNATLGAHYLGEQIDGTDAAEGAVGGTGEHRESESIDVEAVDPFRDREIQQQAVTHRGEVSAFGTAVAELPSRG